MNITQIVERCKSIAMDNLDLKSVYIGNTWDNSNSKGDTYPCLWVEFPILVDYVLPGKTKQYSFSLTFLTLPELDNTEDEMNMISHLEEYADKFLQLLFEDKRLSIVPSPTGLTVKAINQDVACGIRVDIKVNTGRVCDPLCDITELC